MQPITRIETNQRMSRVVQYKGGITFVGGQTANDRTQDIKGQTAQVLQKIDDYLAKVGLDKTRILSAQVWLSDIQANFAGMNEVWDTGPGRAGTRSGHCRGQIGRAGIAGRDRHRRGGGVSAGASARRRRGA